MIHLGRQLARRIRPRENPVLHLPRLLRPLRRHPPAQIRPRVNRHHPRRHHRRTLRLPCPTRRQLAHPHIPPLGRRSFALQPEIPFPPATITPRRHLHPVHKQRQRPVLRLNPITVPLRRTLRMLRRRKRPHPARPPTRLHHRPVNRKNVPVRRVPLVPSLHVIPVIQHLHLNRPQKRLTSRRQWRRPHKNPRIPPGLHVPPFQLEHEILILPHRPQRRHRPPRAPQHAVFPQLPRLRRPVHIHPAGQITPAEHIHKLLLRPARQTHHHHRRQD